MENTIKIASIILLNLFLLNNISYAYGKIYNNLPKSNNYFTGRLDELSHLKKQLEIEKWRYRDAIYIKH